MNAIKDITREVALRCDDCAETVVFMQHNWLHNDIDYEIVIEDSYCGGGEYRGVFGRLRRAWRAFWGKPIYYSGVYVEDPARMESFLKECLAVVQEGEGKT